MGELFLRGTTGSSAVVAIVFAVVFGKSLTEKSSIQRRRDLRLTSVFANSKDRKVSDYESFRVKCRVLRTELTGDLPISAQNPQPRFVQQWSAVSTCAISTDLRCPCAIQWRVSSSPGSGSSVTQRPCAEIPRNFPHSIVAVSPPR